MTLWEEFEEYLWERNLLNEDFNNAAVAEDMGVTPRYATRMIRAYQGAQVRPNSRTLFVLRRLPGTRTTNAMWHVGERAADGRALGKQWVSDAMRRIEIYTEPSLKRIAEKNPRALPVAEGILKGIEGSLEVMVGLLDGQA